MVDLLRTEANERVDLIDFQYATNEVLQNTLQDMGRSFLANPSGAITTWILGGFGMTNPTGKQLTVTKGRALLGYRLNGATSYGMLTVGGDATKTVDMTALTSGTYNVYIRFEYIDANSSSRVFWDPAGSGKEFVQTVPTRLQANWSMRVETSSPGTEWTLIGTADNTGIPIPGVLALVDMRKLYFEGQVSGSYASGWSTDGGGSANDRNADRQLYGVTDLQSFTAAARQCLEDIKGRGLRRWWSRDIGGMNIGFDAAPTEDALAVGDADMGIFHTSPSATSTPTLRMALNDELVYDRTNNRWQFKVNATENLRITNSGVSVAKGLNVGVVSDAPADNAITFGTGNLQLRDDIGGNPALVFDHTGGTEDRLSFTRGASQWIFTVAGTGIATLDSTAFYHTGNLRAGGDVISGSNTFRFQNGSNDYITFNDTTNDLDIYMDGVLCWTFDNTMLDAKTRDISNVGMLQASYVRANSTTVLNPGDGLFTRGVNVGFDAVPADNVLRVGDGNFGMDFTTASKPALFFDSTTALEFDRSSPGGVGYRFVAGGNSVAWIRNDTNYGMVVASNAFLPLGAGHAPPVSGNATLLNRNTTPFMIASVAFDGTLQTSEAYWNVSGVIHTGGTGAYQINYSRSRSVSTLCPGFGSASDASRAVGAVDTVGSGLHAHVYTFNTTVAPWAAAESNFGVLVYSINQ